MSSSSRAPRRWRFLRPASRGAALSVVILFVLAFVLAAGNFLWTAAEVNAANVRARALCEFDADLGTVPLILPKGTQPSRFGVTIIADARTAWHTAGCPGRLGAPDPAFVKWALFYHLPAS